MRLLNDEDKTKLESLIYDYSLRAVLMALEEICDGEAERLVVQYRQNAEHRYSGTAWHYAGQEISKMRLRVQV